MIIPSEPQPIRIAIADAHAIVCDALAAIIKLHPPMELVGKATSCEAALELVRTTQPQLLIMDLLYPVGSGFQLLDDLKIQSPKTAVLIYSGLNESPYAERCVRQGARGFVSKRDDIQALLQAMEKVLRGNVALSPKLTDIMLRRAAHADAPPVAPIEQLSSAEFQVFQLIAQGMSTVEIATAMCKSPKTIETYKSRTKRKLGLKNAMQLAQAATIQFVGGGLWDRINKPQVAATDEAK
jgi:DNA-binding NarL/FixJ family response regulator